MISGHIANDKQWDNMVLKKPTQSNNSKKYSDSQSKKQLSPEEQIERQRTISKTTAAAITSGRAAKKYKRDQLAKLANLDINIIKTMEEGKRIFNENELRKVEKALGLKLPRK